MDKGFTHYKDLQHLNYNLNVTALLEVVKKRSNNFLKQN